MQAWMLVVIGCSVAFLLGLLLVPMWRRLARMVDAGLKGVRKAPAYPFVEVTNAKLVATLFALLAVSIGSWFFSYYVEQQNLNPLWGEIAMALFGVSTAALLGGIVFELFLRREILAEVSETLAEIVTTDKRIVKEIFSQEKRNEIVETMLQVSTGDDLHGSAIYSGLVSSFTGESTRQEHEFRFAFREDLTFSGKFKQEHSDLAEKYYVVQDRLSFRTKLKPLEYFVIGCASSEVQLYELFRNPACLYRWMLLDDDFESLMRTGKGFRIPSLRIGGKECSRLSQKGKLIGKPGNQRLELRFKNPFFGAEQSNESASKIGSVVEFAILSNTLHPREDRVVSIHLVYPTMGMEISFDYDATDIKNVTRLYFFSGGKHSPRVREAFREVSVEPSLATRRRRRIVTVSDDHWLFPDSGVVFVW